MEKSGLALLLLLALIPSLSSAQMLESFEYGVPPPGWTKINLQGGTGWYQLQIGWAPLPGWGNGTSSVPPAVGAGTHNAYCSWDTGGSAAQGYHNDQWIISPRLTGLTATSSLSYWLRFNFTNYPDEVRVRISTAGPAPANFTYVIYTNIFTKGVGGTQFPPWSNTVVNIGNLGIAPGTPIWVAVQEYVWDNTWNGAAVQLDVISSDLTAAPEALVSPASRTFTAYYDGSNPANQTFTLQSVGSSGLGFSGNLGFGAGPTNWLTLGGPSSGTLAFQNSQVFTASVSVAGLDLGTYTATYIITVPGATNSPLRVPITFNVIRRPQTITFPNPGPQWTTNRVGLAGTASSGLPVTFSCYSGPGVVTGATNLTFTGTGIVKVIGWQLGNIYYDVAPTVTNSFTVTKPNAAIVFTDMSHVYDGSPHGATITTVPAGLTVDTTYNGSLFLPVAIGSYAVTSAVNDAVYGGSAVSTFTITRMVQTITFPDPGPQWTTNRVGLAATANSGLPVSFSVASGPGSIAGGTNLTFNGAGTVSVVASHAGDANWLPAAATNAIEVTKATAPVTLNDLNQTYDGTPRVVTAATVPVGLTVNITYDGSGTAPTAAGSYAVTGTVNDAIYQGMDVGTLTVSKADQTITFPALQPRLTNAVVALGASASSGLSVTEFSVVSGPGVINGTNLTFSGVGDVLIAAAQSGNGNWNPAAAVTNMIKAFAVNPLSGPAVGGNEVLITNGRIGDGTSITNVTLCGVVATILDQGTNWVSVQAGAGTPGLGDLEIRSDSEIVVSNAYTYNPTGVIFSASPAIGSYVGGYSVTITGSNLCDGTDVTNVTLCGVTAAVVSQSATQIVVTAGAGEIGLGDVRVCSVSFGEAVAFNAFTYAIAEMSVLGTNGAVIVNGETADADKGADFGNQVVLGAYTNWFAITNSGDAALTILGVTTNGSDAGFFFAPDLPSSVLPGGTASFRVVYAPATLGAHSAAIELLNDSTNTPYVINLAGTAIKRDQDALVFTPASPQAYLTTNALSVSGGSGTGDVSFLVLSGPGTLIGASDLTITAGTGEVVVEVTKASDDLYNAQSVAATVTVAKADQTISFPAVGNQLATNRVGLAATASSELGVTFAVLAGPAVLADGTNVTFTGRGSVSIVANQVGDEDWNPAPTVTNTFAVALAFADVILGDLSQTYDGTLRVATATTDPAGLSVDITYDGSATAPTAAGSYAVTGLVNDAIYEGVQTGTLVVAKASQSIAFPIPGLMKTNDVVGLAAAASSGLPVSFDVLSGPGLLTGGTNLSFTDAGVVRVVASQPGDANWLAAASVTRLFRAGVSALWTDYDGDQVSDLAVYDAAMDASWYIRKVNGDVLCWATNFGTAQMIPVPGDYDGDGAADLTACDAQSGNWYARTLAGVNLMSGTNWWIAGGVPVAGDYDGDGIFDLVLYDEAHGNWYARTVAGQVLMVASNWGYPGAVAVPGDYDGDGVSDLAVYDDMSGNWFVRTVAGGILAMGTNWGYPGTRPVPGDYDGDGIFDLAVYDQERGDWYVRSLSGPILLWSANWGFRGAVPVAGDYDGDGLADMAVYGMDSLVIPARFVGNWFIRKLDGDIILMNENWGYPNTVPVNGE